MLRLIGIIIGILSQCNGTIAFISLVAAFQQDDNAKRAKLVPLSNTTVRCVALKLKSKLIYLSQPCDLRQYFGLETDIWRAYSLPWVVI